MKIKYSTYVPMARNNMYKNNECDPGFKKIIRHSCSSLYSTRECSYSSYTYLLLSNRRCCCIGDIPVVLVYKHLQSLVKRRQKYYIDRYLKLREINTILRAPHYLCKFR